MKKMILFLLACTSCFLVAAQTLEPVQVQYEPSDKAVLHDLFEVKSTGKMHVYVPEKEPVSDSYYYKGRMISSDYNAFLPYDLAKLTFTESTAPFAVYNIKHLDEDYFIIREPLVKTSLLNLYKWEGKKLKKIKLLAYRYAKKDKIYQLDSWLQDMNGDGKIDLVQRKKTKKEGKKSKIKTTIYLMQSDGTYKKAKKMKIDRDHFRMHRF